MNDKEVADGKPAKMGPFTFVEDAERRGGNLDRILGDARLKLDENHDARYAMLLVHGARRRGTVCTVHTPRESRTSYRGRAVR